MKSLYCLEFIHSKTYFNLAEIFVRLYSLVTDKTPLSRSLIRYFGAENFKLYGIYNV